MPEFENKAQEKENEPPDVVAHSTEYEDIPCQDLCPTLVHES